MIGTRHTIALPRNFHGFTMAPVVAQLTPLLSSEKLSHIDFSFADLTFVRPSGAVFLGNLVSWLREKKIQISATQTNPNSPSVKFLDDSGFFAQHFGGPLTIAARPRRTTVPLKQVTQSASHGWLRLTFLPWLAGCLDTTEESLYPLQVCLSEIFNNIADHTKFDIGTIFAQHYPVEHSVEVAIADFGRGIPNSVRTVQPGLSDVGAIMLAVKEGFSTMPTPRNRGAGLDYLMRTAVVTNRGAVTIFSGSGIVRFSPEAVGNGYAISAFPNNGYSPGTLIRISFRTDTIARIPEASSEDLQW